MIKRLSQNFGAAGLLFVLIGLARFYIQSQWTWLEYAALGAGGALILFYLIFDFKELLDAFTSRGALQTANAVLMSLIVIALLAVANFLANRHSFRLDTTAARQFSLADQTIKVLQGLQEELKVSAFYAPQQQENFEDLLKEYAAITPKFKYEFIDPDKKPREAERFAIKTYGTSVISYQATDEKLNTETEEALTNAIIKVTRGETKKIYFTTHHGERGLDDEERLGVSLAKKVIAEKNYQVTSVALLENGRVPEDCAVLVIAGPQTPFLQHEIEMMQEYLKRGGALYLLVDPDAPTFHEIVKDFGITLGNDLIVDLSGVGQLFGTGPDAPVVAAYGEHAITKDFVQFMTVYPRARSIAVTEPAPAGVEATELAMTSPQSWAETDAQEIESGHVKFDETKDRRGPISVAAAATKTIASDSAGTAPERKSRLVVFGDSDFAANYLFDFQKNGDFFMSALSWLAEEEDLISIRPRDPEDRRLNLTAAGSKLLMLVSVGLLPLAAFVAAMAFYIKRK